MAKYFQIKQEAIKVCPELEPHLGCMVSASQVFKKQPELVILPQQVNDIAKILNQVYDDTFELHKEDEEKLEDLEEFNNFSEFIVTLAWGAGLTEKREF